MPRFEIADVARLTRVAPMTLRAWELRYGASQPRRGKGKARYYSYRDVRRLNLIAEACRSGYRVGEVASRPTAELAVLMRARRDAWNPNYQEVEPICAALRAGHASQLLELIAASVARRPLADFADHVLRPCAKLITSDVCTAQSIAYERLWTGALESTIHALAAQVRPVVAQPQVFSATLAPERHGIGALLTHGISSLCGVRSINLGVDLMPEDVLEVATATPHCVMTLSFVSEVVPQKLAKLLNMLDQRLHPSTRLVLGGRGVSNLGGLALPVAVCG